MTGPGETADVEDDETAPPVPGMQRTTPERALAAEQAAVTTAAAAEGPVVSEARMKELKDKARREIEQRLAERRKKRRLLRGGDASGGFSVS